MILKEKEKDEKNVCGKEAGKEEAGRDKRNTTILKISKLQDQPFHICNSVNLELTNSSPLAWHLFLSPITSQH